MLNYQWMMVFALPLMLLYNGKQGLKMKYFFYLYYPLHVYALVIAARLLRFNIRKVICLPLVYFRFFLSSLFLWWYNELN